MLNNISTNLKPANSLIKVSESGCHRPPVAGIHGRESDGAFSLVLSGGYEDDVVSQTCNV